MAKSRASRRNESRNRKVPERTPSTAPSSRELSDSDLAVTSQILIENLKASVALLAPYVKGFTEHALQKALADFSASTEATHSDTYIHLIDKHSAAKMLGVHWFTVYRMMRDGQLTAVKIRGQWRIPIPAIKDLIANICNTNNTGHAGCSGMASFLGKNSEQQQEETEEKSS